MSQQAIVTLYEKLLALIFGGDSNHCLCPYFPFRRQALTLLIGSLAPP